MKWSLKNDAKMNKSKSWFFEKINKIDKILTLQQKKREDPKNKIKNERREKTMTPKKYKGL